MSDLISRQAAIDAFGLSEKTRKYGGDHSGYDTRMLYEIQNILEGLPSAQSEIIRCKECQYRSKRYLCDVWDAYITNDDYYCGSGKRREE